MPTDNGRRIRRGADARFFAERLRRVLCLDVFALCLGLCYGRMVRSGRFAVPCVFRALDGIEVPGVRRYGAVPCAAGRRCARRVWMQSRAVVPSAGVCMRWSRRAGALDAAPFAHAHARHASPADGALRSSSLLRRGAQSPGRALCVRPRPSCIPRRNLL